jgi:phosphatidylglycerophosphate synthase
MHPAEHETGVDEPAVAGSGRAPDIHPTGRDSSLAVRHGNFFRDASALRRRSERSQAMLWSRHVNRPLGAIFAQALLRTRITPNAVSITGAFAALVGAAVVVAAPTPAPAPVALAVFVIWELSLALDNADGLLARARGQSSPFGAWLDQILDFVNHIVVAGSLAAFFARAFELRPSLSALLASFLVAGSLIGLFASSQRNALLGTEPALAPASAARLWPLLLGRHLTDFGAFLAVAAAGLVLPPLLGVALVVWPTVITASVAGQVFINWPRRKV